MTDQERIASLEKAVLLLTKRCDELLAMFQTSSNLTVQALALLGDTSFGDQLAEGLKML